jgi:hypothetical protein
LIGDDEGDEHEYAGKIDHRRDLVVIQVRLDERELRNEHGYEGRTY